MCDITLYKTEREIQRNLEKSIVEEKLTRHGKNPKEEDMTDTSTEHAEHNIEHLKLSNTIPVKHFQDASGSRAIYSVRFYRLNRF